MRLHLSPDARDTLDDALRIFTETAGDEAGRLERVEAVEALARELDGLEVSAGEIRSYMVRQLERASCENPYHLRNDRGECLERLDTPHEAPPRPHEAELQDTGSELERTERHERDNERDRERAADQ